MPKSPTTLKDQVGDTDPFDHNSDLVNQLAVHDLGTLGDTNAATIEAAYVTASGGASVAGSVAMFTSTNPYFTVAAGGGAWDSVQLTAAG
jgi:hypothetical protein